jgi:hypothetical protein
MEILDLQDLVVLGLLVLQEKKENQDLQDPKARKEAMEVLVQPGLRGQ